MEEQDARTWDREAATFDDSADHGLRDPAVRTAWAELLRRTLPPAPARIADLGCGTGSLAVLAAELGHTVDGVDFSPSMLAVARAKTAGLPGVTLHLGDAADPPLSPHGYDVVMCRHLLWALSEPDAALGRWVELLRPRGRLLLVEGRWSTGAGLSRDETTALLRRAGLQPTVEPLDNPDYWGRPVTDDRYLAVAETEPDRC
ncbi:methyltransferase domain-containing protein [Auraticoccus sp. F435]|uniref:Methyltransferase domain-containing protein n=1 Tax=Auraticoccus cholistanensis TaxID=2656650 RepID=A0A6A9UYD6_9ACTN|nr:methyltransferase domain-containing protein [Auraticoccus cholistanensis]